MPSQTKNILIFGGTGLIGQYITNAILDNKSSFSRIALFTTQNTVANKPSFIEQCEAQGAEIIIGDLTSATDVREAYSGFDTIVSAVGRNVIHTQIQMIEIADAHPDVKKFFPSEYGTDIEYGPASRDEKPHQQKLKVREAMRKVRDLEFTYVVTGPYCDLYLHKAQPGKEAAGSWDVEAKKAVLLGGGEGRVSFTSMRDVGRLTVAALLRPEGARNRALKVNSFTATPKEILAEFEKQTGGKGWEVEFTDLETLRRLEGEAWEKGDVAAGVFTLRRIWTEGGTLYDRRDNDLIGMEDGMEDLETAVNETIADQTQSSTI